MWGIESGETCDPLDLLKIRNCTIADNSSYGINVEHNWPRLINCVVWDEIYESPSDAAEDPAEVFATYSNILGSWPGVGNINADPQFVQDPLGDYYLSHMAAGQGIDSQSDAAGGTGCSQVWDVAQHYMIGPDTAGGSWGNWALGQTLDPNVGLEYAAVVSGDTYTYEAAVPQYDNYGGFSGGATIPTTLTEDNTVRFDLLILTRHSSGVRLTGRKHPAQKIQQGTGSPPTPSPAQRAYLAILTMTVS